MPPTPLPAALTVHLTQRFPKAQRSIPNGEGWPLHEPSAFEVQQAVFPGLLALAVAIPEPHQRFVACGVSTNNHQNTMPRVLQAVLEVEALHPEIAVPFPREAALLPLRQFVLPALCQPADRRRGEARRLSSPDGL